MQVPCVFSRSSSRSSNALSSVQPGGAGEAHKLTEDAGASKDTKNTKPRRLVKRRKHFKTDLGTRLVPHAVIVVAITPKREFPGGRSV